MVEEREKLGHKHIINVKELGLCDTLLVKYFMLFKWDEKMSQKGKYS